MSGNPYPSTGFEASRGAEPSPVQADRVTAMLEAGIAEHRAGRLGEAERIYRGILALEPGNSEPLHRLGMVALQTGHGHAAIELMRRAIANCAIANRPEDAAYWIDLGIALQTQGELAEAMRSYERTLELKPESAAAWSNRGLALHSLGRLEEAAASLEWAIELNPEVAVTHANLGNVRQAQGRLEEAEASQRRAIALQPANAEAYCNLGSVLDLMGKFQDSVAAYERALALRPDLAAARWNRALHRLREGDFRQGLPEYEARWQLQKRSAFTQPQWRGEPLAGARILLHAEQGLGDTVQFLRYVPMVQAAGGEVVLEVQPSLRRLAAELSGIADLIVDLIVPGNPLPEFAWHCPLMSLPLAFGTTLKSIPAQTPYLPVPDEARERAARLRWPEGGLRVGLAWAGSPGHLKDRYRSVPLELLQPLLAVDGVRFFSLQVGPASAELAALAESRITDLVLEIGDMADTAALIERLDLVIGVDTAVAHLAGALGRPVWVLLPVSSDWRWLRNREDSPWYPAMRLFRQRELGEWRPAIDMARAALEEWVALRDL